MSKLKKGENTRNLIIEKATLLFTKNGYNNTSLNQILEATGLAKGGFYFHFKSKEELGIAVIKSLEQCWTRDVLPKLIQGRNAKEKLELMFSSPGECNYRHQLRPTVLLLNLATEMIEVNEKFSQMLQQIFRGWWIIIEAIIEEGKLENIFRKEVDSTAVAAIILSNIMGANLLALINGDDGIYTKQLGALKTVLFDGISSRRHRK
ncbi:TetR family transcriptional regulator [candidate division KSB1 bacterium]|nr:TetR family transcriptional regulator [candidate division KSB1 bacterium]